jgi:hypothetical protein
MSTDSLLSRFKFCDREDSGALFRNFEGLKLNRNLVSFVDVEGYATLGLEHKGLINN